MTIPFEKDKKRIIILDKDLVSVSSEGVRCFMKKVLGRHYENLKNKGAGWSFPAFQEPAFKDWEASLWAAEVVAEKENIQVVPVSTQTDSQTITTSDASTQTEEISKEDKDVIPGRYKFDIDPSLQRFGKQWLMG